MDQVGSGMFLFFYERDTLLLITYLIKDCSMSNKLFIIILAMLSISLGGMELEALRVSSNEETPLFGHKKRRVKKASLKDRKIALF